MIEESTANDAYLAHLTGWKPKSKKAARYVPNFTISKDSLDAKKLSRKKWEEASFECSVDVTEADITFFTTESDPARLDEHLAFMASDGKRNAEVSLRWLRAADRRKFQDAQNKEMDQWVDNAVFSIARKAGVPIERIMTMR